MTTRSPHLDRRLGALLDELHGAGCSTTRWSIVTSDHGEHLGDHLLFFHGCSLYRQLVEVPLVIVDPKAVPAGRAVAEPVSLRDLPATVLDLLGLERGRRVPRAVARPVLGPGRRGGSARRSSRCSWRRTSPTLLTNQGREPAAKGPMKALVAGGMHYIRSGDGSEELYFLKRDPEEQTNLAKFVEFHEHLENFRTGLRSMLRTVAPAAGRTAGPVEARTRRE